MEDSSNSRPLEGCGITPALLKEANNRVAALRAEVYFLRSPNRRSGPSRYEAEDRAKELETEADLLDEQLYYASSPAIAHASNPST